MCFWEEKQVISQSQGWWFFPTVSFVLMPHIKDSKFRKKKINISSQILHIRIKRSVRFSHSCKIMRSWEIISRCRSCRQMGYRSCQKCMSYATVIYFSLQRDKILIYCYQPKSRWSCCKHVSTKLDDWEVKKKLFQICSREHTNYTSLLRPPVHLIKWPLSLLPYNSVLGACAQLKSCRDTHSWSWC